jgi:hypothetical protein
MECFCEKQMGSGAGLPFELRPGACSAKASSLGGTTQAIRQTSTCYPYVLRLLSAGDRLLIY